MLATPSFHRVAAMPNESPQLNLGSLRSAMSLTLHPHHAARIWHSRLHADDRPGIVGLNGFIAIMNKMKRGSEQDDPYSDGWMLRIEDKLEQTKANLQTLREQVDLALADVPPALSLGENLNIQPVKLPLFINSQLGSMAVYLLAEYDDLARKLILAHHTALIDRSTLERWLNEGAHALRGLFSVAQQYRYSGATRDDFAAKNAVAHAAIEKFGELPQEIIDGTRRSRFAPPVARRGPRKDAEAETDVGTTVGTATERIDAAVHDEDGPISTQRHATSLRWNRPTSCA
jgi:integrating conjugative element protein (TIGR03761 family)